MGVIPWWVDDDSLVAFAVRDEKKNEEQGENEKQTPKLKQKLKQKLRRKRKRKLGAGRQQSSDGDICMDVPYLPYLLVHQYK
jgi:macrodomain Ter protein organizer (MatP/YcbG family)